MGLSPSPGRFVPRLLIYRRCTTFVEVRIPTCGRSAFFCGKQVAFDATVGGAQNDHIFVVDAAGGEPRDLGFRIAAQLVGGR